MTIKEARLAAGLTQRSMSERMGIPMRTIGSWEDGSRSCPAWAERLVIAELQRIAEAGSRTETAMLEAERIAKDPSVKGCTDLDELFADLEK